ncbi:uncharacterized protein LOC133814299 [Humulus lupulus]|uniref:uncharacterized protein LOC133814299 n=1 Tax=Humulus lupulus TaxID=3486 RepID=UPI002B41067F|nr:uncharacterized protein LOC133814299 [Humulus lupulus]
MLTKLLLARVLSLTLSFSLDFHVVNFLFSIAAKYWSQALVKIGFSLDSPAFYTVCESFDQKKNGRFRLDDFISLCIFLQSARNMFDSFDTAKQGRVTLDLNQFVYCIRERKKRKERKTTPVDGKFKLHHRLHHLQQTKLQMQI